MEHAASVDIDVGCGAGRQSMASESKSWARTLGFAALGIGVFVFAAVAGVRGGHFGLMVFGGGGYALYLAWRARPK